MSWSACRRRARRSSGPRVRARGRLGRGGASARVAVACSLTDEPPRRKPGCAAKNTYDAASLRALDGAGFDELEEMFERGWTDGLPGDPADARARRGDAGRPRSR